VASPEVKAVDSLVVKAAGSRVKAAVSQVDKAVVSPVVSPAADNPEVARQAAGCQAVECPAAARRVARKAPAVHRAVHPVAARLAVYLVVVAETKVCPHRPVNVAPAAARTVVLQVLAGKPVELRALTEVLTETAIAATARPAVTAAIQGHYRVALAAWDRQENALAAALPRRIPKQWHRPAELAVAAAQRAVANLKAVVLVALDRHRVKVLLAAVAAAADLKAVWPELAVQAVPANFRERVPKNVRSAWARNLTNRSVGSMRC
jgi:hypothetical protein